MLLKPGVDISRLRPPIRRALCVLDEIYKKYDSELVITSTYDGNHLPCSLHYQHLAVDFRFPKSQINMVVSEIRNRLGSDYDVVVESDHIHLEYDPKEK